MNNEIIAKFALKGKVEGKRHVGMLKILWLPTALKDLNIGKTIDTANNRSAWKRLC